jgi:hypothetical protein
MLAALFGATFTPAALAHKSSDSYLWLTIDGTALSGRWDIALRDLDYAIGLDADGDGAITWGEVRAAQPAITAYALSRLAVDGGDCTLMASDLLIAEHSDGRYASLVLAGQCARTPAPVTLRYSLLFDLDARHRGLLNLSLAGRHDTGIFAPDRRELSFGANASGGVFLQYLREGLWHVWTGWDHMLFLAGLFLPAVLRRVHGEWQVAPALDGALRETAALVTAFTLAHATTLSLAATGAFSLPSRLVESLVAATVLFAGLNNLVPMVQRRLYLLAGGFGLIHGAAIAGALIELGLPAGARVEALFAFNIGVELAQLALIAVVVPLAFRFRRSAAFRRWLLVPGTALVALIGLLWLLQRALLLPIPLPI